MVCLLHLSIKGDFYTLSSSINEEGGNTLVYEQLSCGYYLQISLQNERLHIVGIACVPK